MPVPAIPERSDGGFSVYDLLFLQPNGELSHDAEFTADWLPSTAGRPSEEAVIAGYVSGVGPGITPERWPRSATTGWPMAHFLTLWLPPRFRRRGPDLPGISLFQGDGQYAEPYTTMDPSDEFLRDLGAHTPHPREVQFVDVIDGRFAMIWHTEDEMWGFSGPPPDTRNEVQRAHVTDGANAWDTRIPDVQVRLTLRVGDPNAGIAPRCSPGKSSDDGGYLQYWDDDRRDFREWAKRLSQDNHLGGTMFSVQGVPEGASPYFLSVTPVGDMDLGDGAQIIVDLERETLDWACT